MSALIWTVNEAWMLGEREIPGCQAVYTRNLTNCFITCQRFTLTSPFFYLSCCLLLYCVVKWLKGYQLCCFTLKYSTDCHCPVSFKLLLNQEELKWLRFVRLRFELLTPSVTSENKGTGSPGYTYNVILSLWTTLSEGNHLPDWDTKQLEKVTLKTRCKIQGTLHICAELSPDKLILF